MLTSDQFIAKAKQIVFDYAKDHLDKTDNVDFTTDNVYVVWSSYILGNQKALLSTTLPDGLYYEITYDANKNRIYFDAYKKWENRCIEVD